MSAEQLILRSRFQAFLFAGAICIMLFEYAAHDSEVAVIHAVTAIALAAILAFVVLQALHIIWPPKLVATERSQSADGAPAWLDADQIGTARGFILLGLLIYIAYHYLDTVVVPDAQRVQAMLLVRLAASLLITLTWLLSFTKWFARHYIGIISTVTALAGSGVGVLFHIAGPNVHFYYEGFIQVIAFAAFAFRLPPRPLGFICALQLITYAAIALSQSTNWDYFSLPKEQQAVIANNLTSLLTFVALAMAASAALHSRKTRTEADPGDIGG